jgi:hypothetical protein
LGALEVENQVPKELEIFEGIEPLRRRKKKNRDRDMKKAKRGGGGCG